MPERIFQYETTEDLIPDIKELARLVGSGSGSINSLKNSHTGFLKETGEVSQQQLRTLLQLGKWEIYLRGAGLHGLEADPICADLQPNNPLHDKVMRVKTVHGPGHGMIGGGFGNF